MLPAAEGISNPDDKRNAYRVSCRTVCYSQKRRANEDVNGGELVGVWTWKRKVKGKVVRLLDLPRCLNCLAAWLAFLTLPGQAGFGFGDGTSQIVPQPRNWELADTHLHPRTEKSCGHLKARRLRLLEANLPSPKSSKLHYQMPSRHPAILLKIGAVTNLGSQRSQGWIRSMALLLATPTCSFGDSVHLSANSILSHHLFRILGPM